ncbi:hypothetical protein K525DRAFT_245089 [Schizophyllum commune Loenen D]|nr:hypothetical protein K525DRAFT_245089 [Schizophyllum commune Loenen D]
MARGRCTTSALCAGAVCKLPPRLRARRKGARNSRSELSGRFALGNASANSTSASGSPAQSNTSDTSGSGSNGARRLASPTTRTQDSQRIAQAGDETTGGSHNDALTDTEDGGVDVRPGCNAPRPLPSSCGGVRIGGGHTVVVGSRYCGRGRLWALPTQSTLLLGLLAQWILIPLLFT